MTMKTINIKLCRCHLHLGDFGEIRLVIDAVTQYIAKIAKSALQGICRPLLLCLLEGRSFALAILNVAIPDILMERTIPQGHADNDREA